MADFMTTQLSHLVDIQSLSQQTLFALLDQAEAWLQPSTPFLVDSPLVNAVIATLFYEDSTRTRISFQLATKRLQAHCLDFVKQGSSVSKGESLEDTAANLIAMGAQIIVLRHPEPHTPAKLIDAVGDRAAIVNAGDGAYAHPTQALLDLLTIQQHKPNLSPLSVAIIGDVLHSRVARSQISALHTCGVTDIRVIAPANLLPQDINTWPVTLETDIEQGVSEADVVICLRLQKERMSTEQFPDNQAYYHQFGLSPQRLALAKPDAIVMHPGPINRNVEIADAVADGKQSVILQQVHNGIVMRMAVLAALASAR